MVPPEEIAELKAATERQQAVRARFREQDALNRTTRERFYYTIAAFAGATIVASVTFLGFLKASGPLHSLPTLFASWIILLISAAAGIFQPYLYSSYSHYAHLDADNDAHAQSLQKEEAASSHLIITGISGDESRREYADQRQKLIVKYQEGSAWAKAMGRRYSRAERTCGWAARCGLLFGWLSLVIFAIRSI